MKFQRMILERRGKRNYPIIMSRPQLFCFTHAGGNAAFFEGIEKELPELELVKPEYAGHGARYREPFYQEYNELADDVYQIVKEQYAGGDYALFGYSMGSISLVEVLKRIVSDPEMNEPLRVFLAAHEPHSKAELIGFTEDEQDEWVKDRTIRFGEVPKVLLNNKSFWRMYLPVYRADYSIIGKYSFEDLSLRTLIPATVFYSETDTPRTEMELWKRYFTGECEFIQYEGTHFFIRDHHSEMADVIRTRMQGRKN